MLVGFKPKFSPKIQNGSKGFTLRFAPKRMPKIGETLYMYTGLRTKNCQLITKDFKLLGIENVELKISHLNGLVFDIDIRINGRLLANKYMRLFYVMDGFDTQIDFINYWTEGFKKTEIEVSLKMFRWVKLPF